MRTDDPRVAEILDVVSVESGVERAQLVPEATIADLGLSSLDLVETIFAIESKFGIEIPTDGPLNGTDVTVGMLVDEVLALLDAKSGADVREKRLA